MSNQWVSRDVQQKRAEAERMHHNGTLAARAWLDARPTLEALEARLRAERERVGPEALAWVAVLSEAFQRLHKATKKAESLRELAATTRHAAKVKRRSIEEAVERAERHADMLEDSADKAMCVPLYDQRGLPRLNAVQRDEVWRAAEEAEQEEAREWRWLDENPYEPWDAPEDGDPYYDERLEAAMTALVGPRE